MYNLQKTREQLSDGMELPTTWAELDKKTL